MAAASSSLEFSDSEGQGFESCMAVRNSLKFGLFLLQNSYTV